MRPLRRAARAAVRLLATKAVDADATICIVLSETGLKTEAPPPARHGTAFDEASLRRLVEERLRVTR